MQLVRSLPHPALRSVVGEYVDFELRTGMPETTIEPPVRSLVVIVDLDTGWTVDGERFGSFAAGLYARPVHVRHEGSARCLQLYLEPPAARALLGVPAGELSHLTVTLDDLLGPDAGRLAERLHSANDAAARFAVLDAVLRRRLEQARAQTRPDVERAWGLLRASGGRIRVDALAGALGCSRRHLSARFGEDVGISPKLAARVMRFEAARARLGRVPLARLAAEHGFADQAHLAREFRALGGAPPTSFPSVQDGDAAAA